MSPGLVNVASSGLPEKDRHGLIYSRTLPDVPALRENQKTSHAPNENRTEIVNSHQE
ncbi:hypothetical protein GRAN_3971 [Granulicella sibirica]|uniref:Uncharacterized protein n=1 Tax=Granulicella sibirica TaxID=2479048 RepID=A0A4Q0SVP2_9BACT|nr:hypothetical protein GRAN_3971 [Granulicella sibirica]